MAAILLSPIRIQAASPATVLFGSIIFWLFLAILAPVQITISFSYYSYILLFCNFMMLFVGLCCLPSSRRIPRTIEFIFFSQRLKLFIRLTSVLGFIGLLARGSDWFYLRGANIYMNTYEFREALKYEGASVISVLGGLLIPFTVVPFLLCVVADRHGIATRFRFAYVALMSAWPLMTILKGSRSALILFFGLFIVARYISGVHIKYKFGVLVLFAATTAAITTSLIVLGRNEDFGFDILRSSYFSSYTNFVPISDDFRVFFDESRKIVFSVAWSWAHICQYALHAIPEYLYLIDNYIGDAHTLGGHHFFVFKKFLSIMGIVQYDANAIFGGMPRTGISTTFFGPLFVDFGYYSPFFSFLFGLFVSWTRRRAIGGDIGAVPMYVLLLYQVALVPIASGIMLSSAFYFNFSFGAFWLAYWFLLRPVTYSNSPNLPVGLLKE